MAKPKFEETLPVESSEEKPKFSETEAYTPSAQTESLPLLERILTPIETAETVARSALEGLTLGVSEPVISGGVATLESIFGGEKFGEAFSKDVARRRELEAAAGGIATAAEVAGAIAPALISGGAAAPISAARIGAKGLTALPRAVEAMGAAAASKVPTTLGRAAARGATEAGVSQAIKESVQAPTGFIQPGEELGAKEAAKGGAAVGAGLAALPAIGGGTMNAFTRVISAFGGVKPETIKKYLQREHPLTEISLEDLKEVVDAQAAKVQASLASQRHALTSNLQAAVKTLKTKVNESSDFSYSILQQAEEEAEKAGKPIKLNLSDFIGSIDRQIENQKSEGGIVFGPVRKQTVKYLQALKEDFGGSPLFEQDRLSLTMAKDMIQALDRITKYASSQGEYSPDLDRALQAIRSQLNDRLIKMIPEYGEQMKEVATDTKLLIKIDELFGTPEAAAQTLKRLESGTDPELNKVFLDFQNRTNLSFRDDLAKIGRESNVERIKPLQSENFIRSVMNQKSVENKNALRLLSDLSDQDLVALAEDAQLTREFNAIYSDGSRSTNFWAMMFGAIPATGVGAMGGLAVSGTPQAMAAGALVGYLVKTFGPRATRTLLDQVIKIKGLPTVKKLNAIMGDLPPEMRSSLTSGFIRAQNSYFEQDPERQIAFDEDVATQLRAEIQSSDMDSVQKSKALQSLQKDRTIKAGHLRRLMLGKEPKIPFIQKIMGPGARLPEKKDEALAADEMGPLDRLARKPAGELETEYVGELADEMAQQEEPIIEEQPTEDEIPGETYEAMEEEPQDVEPESQKQRRKEFDELVNKMRLDLGFSAEQALNQATKIYGSNPWEEEDEPEEDPRKFEPDPELWPEGPSLFERTSRTIKKKIK